MASKYNTLLFAETKAFIKLSRHEMNSPIEKLKTLQKEIELLEQKLYQQRIKNSKIATQNNKTLSVVSNVSTPSVENKIKHRYPLRNRNKNNNKATNKFQCNFCRMLLISKAALRTHHRVHAIQRPFQCKECGSRFRYKHHLERHILIHTGDKPYACPCCAKRFNTISNMKRHHRNLKC